MADAAAGASNAKVISLKLLINKTERKVLFAEAEKDAVDFIFHILTLPIGCAIKLLKERKMKMAGCIGNVYESVQTLSQTCIQLNKTKEILLDPKIPMLDDGETSFPSPLFPLQVSVPDPDPLADQTHEKKKHELRGGDAPTTPAKKKQRLEQEEEEEEGGGFVKRGVKFMVMDDLSVKPILSTNSTIAFCVDEFKVKRVGVLEEKVVVLGVNEALSLLATSLAFESSVLTTVFLRNMSRFRVVACEMQSEST